MAESIFLSQPDFLRAILRQFFQDCSIEQIVEYCQTFSKAFLRPFSERVRLTCSPRVDNCLYYLRGKYKIGLSIQLYAALLYYTTTILDTQKHCFLYQGALVNDAQEKYVIHRK